MYLYFFIPYVSVSFTPCVCFFCHSLYVSFSYSLNVIPSFFEIIFVSFLISFFVSFIRYVIPGVCLSIITIILNHLYDFLSILKCAILMVWTVIGTIDKSNRDRVNLTTQATHFVLEGGRHYHLQVTIAIPDDLHTKGRLQDDGVTALHQHEQSLPLERKQNSFPAQRKDIYPH